MILFEELNCPDNLLCISDVDEEMTNAIQSAYTVDVDSFINTVCTLDDWGLEAAIDDLLDEEDGDADVE